MNNIWTYINLFNSHSINSTHQHRIDSNIYSKFFINRHYFLYWLYHNTNNKYDSIIKLLDILNLKYFSKMDNYSHAMIIANILKSTNIYRMNPYIKYPKKQGNVEIDEWKTNLSENEINSFIL